MKKPVVFVRGKDETIFMEEGGKMRVVPTKTELKRLNLQKRRFERECRQKLTLTQVWLAEMFGLKEVLGT